LFTSAATGRRPTLVLNLLDTPQLRNKILSSKLSSSHHNGNANPVGAPQMIHTGQLGMGPGPSSSGEPPQDSNLGKWKEADGKGAAAAGPVKAACLSCRQKKAKCDGAKPACGQVSNRLGRLHFCRSCGTTEQW